jgi:pimeloyl-ACP methyl ester carboxylesterase
MISLGYSQYVIQGGDWGSMISRIQARMFPDAVRAVHVNMAAISWTNLLLSPLLLLRSLVTPWTQAERKGLAKGKEYGVSGNGYYRMQSTRPLTVAYCLADSPVALLGWIFEKLQIWSEDSNAAWSDDELLDWMSVYWFSEAGPGSSVYTYHEAEAGIKTIGGFWEYMPAPLGVTQFPADLVGMPRMFLRTLGNVVFERWAAKGGHFAAWEAPEELVQDLRVMFGTGGGAYGVVKGKDGYGDSKKDR